LNCSDETAAEIDAEVVAILKESYDKALEMLRENRDVMDKLAAFLIEKETISGKEFMKIFREEKGIPEPEEKPKDDAEEKVQDAEQKEDVTDSAQPAEESPEVKETSGETAQAKESSSAEVKDDHERGLFSNGRID
jgi:cell division protease FtsH